MDTAINMGVGRAARFVQRALNVLSGSSLKVDGVLGKITLHYLTEYLVDRDEITFVKALNCMQGEKYIQLAERREKDQKFIYGWLKNRVRL